MDFQVRELKTKDLYMIVKLLGKCGKDALSSISESLSVAAKAEQNVEKNADGSIKNNAVVSSSYSSVGLTVISTILLYAESDIKPFFAGLINQTLEEFDNMPFDTTLAIVEELGKKEDLPNFFKRAISLTSIFSSKE